MTISTCEISQNQNAKGFKIKFKVFGTNDYVETPIVQTDHVMKFNFAHVVAYKQLTKVIIAKLVLLIGALFFNLSFNLGALEFF